MLDPAFRLQKYATVPFVTALAVPAVGSSFGSYLYAASAGITAAHPEDVIYRIDLATGKVEPFFQLPDESDPIALDFGPGPPYTSNLYISSNNRDTAAGIPDGQDFGGSIVYLEPD